MTHTESIEKVRDLIKGIRIALLTTSEADGTLRSRPMGTQEAEFDGDLWFFTKKDSAKIDEIAADPQVNVSYSDPGKMSYVSVSGTARMVEDKAKMKELWQPTLKMWFPDGLDDPEITLLKVEVSQAEYWDSPSNKFVRVAGFVKAMATGNTAQLGTNEKLDLHKS